MEQRLKAGSRWIALKSQVYVFQRTTLKIQNLCLLNEANFLVERAAENFVLLAVCLCGVVGLLNSEPCPCLGSVFPLGYNP